MNKISNWISSKISLTEEIIVQNFINCKYITNSADNYFSGIGISCQSNIDRYRIC